MFTVWCFAHPKFIPLGAQVHNGAINLGGVHLVGRNLYRGINSTGALKIFDDSESRKNSGMLI